MDGEQRLTSESISEAQMAERPVLDQINLVVTDMDASLAFYRRIGVDIPERDPKWDAHHRSANIGGGLDFDLDSTPFAKDWNAGSRGPACVVGFKVSSSEAVDALYAELTGAGYRGQQPPFDAFWGSRYAVVEDPDGNPVGFMGPRDPAKRWDIDPPS
jgi:catechol 2,3-dioxygenase-like lactoylglutathione lyase family enzyme